MAKYISNRNGGKTDEQGHYRFHVNAWDGNILNDGLKVKQNSPLGMSVLIEPGDVKIDYSTYGYTGWNDADEAVTIATADGSNPRIDRIVVYVDRVMTPNPSNSNNPGMLKFMSVAGTPAGSPSPVSDSTVNTAVSNNPWCELAQVQVNSGASTITNGSITDKRTIATPKIADGAVTADKVDFTTGIWWEEIGRTTLSSSSDTITVSSIPARKYLQIRVNYSSVGGTISAHIRFNNDGGANYAYQYATLGGTSTSATNDGGIIITGAATSMNQHVVVDILNISNKEKLSQFIRTEGNATGAGTAPNPLICIGKWANTSAQINRIDIVNVFGSGDFAIGSELVVLGHN